MNDFDWGVLAGFAIGTLGTLFLVTMFEALHVIEWLVAKLDEWVAGVNKECGCVPCATPAYGAPGFDHCAACCSGSLIAEYVHDCPVADHAAMAFAQWGSQR